MKLALAFVLVLAALLVFAAPASGNVCFKHPERCTPPPPPPATTVLLRDDFSGAAGAPLNAAVWTVRDNDCAEGITIYSCARASNVYQDGAGHAVLRAQREPTNFLSGGPYSGAFIGTFTYSGWPPPGIKFDVAVPFRVQMSALMPNSPGLWPALWPSSTNRTTTQGIYELDVAEERMTRPAVAECHEHLFNGGFAWDGSLALGTSMAAAYHTYGADVYADHVDYSVDGVRCGTGPAPGVAGRFGLLLDNVVAAPGSWGAEGGQPAASDPGPWPMLIDWIEVDAL